MGEWKCHTIDIKSAYLQGNNIQRKIFLKPPKEYDDGRLWKLKKTVYGLCDAARAWYLRVKDELKLLSIEICSVGKSLFFWRRNGKIEGIICIYVDDFLYAGTQLFCNMVIEKLKEKFLIGSAEAINFTYVGLRVKGWNDNRPKPIYCWFGYGPNKQKMSIRKEGSIRRKGKERIPSLSWSTELGINTYKTRHCI